MTHASQPSAAGARGPGKIALIFWLIVMLLLWSFNYIAGKIALRHMDPLSLTSFRFVLAALFMLPIYFAQPARAKLRARDIWPFLYLGFFGVVLNQGLFTVGLNYTTSGHAAVIVALGPIVILLLAWAFRQESLTPGKVVGMILSFLGIMFLETDHGFFSRSPLLLGDVISLGGTIGFAFYVVLGKSVAEKYDAISMNTFNCLAAAILLSPLALHQAWHIHWAGIGWAGWAGLVYMAAGSSVAAYLIFFWALRYLSASRIGAVSYFQPIMVILLAAAFLSEHPTRNLLVGTVLVLLGVYMAERAPV